MNIKRLAAAGIILLSTGFAASAAAISGFSDATNNGGGSWTFTFDTLPGPDILGNTDGLSFTNGSGLSLIATGTNAGANAQVIQDVPARGGLGVQGFAGASSPGGDNMASGEVLKLTFNGLVNILGWTFNGGHTNAASGNVGITGLLNFNHSLAASDWDGVNSNGEHSAQGNVCGVDPTHFCGLTMITFAPTNFTGYLESITVQVSQVPLPAGSLLLLSGLGGLTALRRRRKS